MKIATGSFTRRPSWNLLAFDVIATSGQRISSSPWLQSRTVPIYIFQNDSASPFVALLAFLLDFEVISDSCMYPFVFDSGIPEERDAETAAERCFALLAAATFLPFLLSIAARIFFARARTKRP